jgi:NADH-quinone oxidoreductase subunit G
MSRYNGAVNGYFICDRGRFGYEFANDEKRIRKAKIRIKKEDDQVEVENEILMSILETSFSQHKKIIGIGSPRASIESNFALSTLVGKGNFYHGISKKEQLLTKTVLDFLQNSGVQTPSLKQIEKADAVIVLGEDIINTAPMIALALRQAVRNVPNEEADKKGIPLWNDVPVRILAQDAKSPVYIATPYKDGLDEIAENTFRGSYVDIANLGFAIASSINNKAPDSKIMIKDQQDLAEKIAVSLKNAKNPLVISGVNSGDVGIIHAAFNIANALFSNDTKVMFSVVLPECNSMGLALIPGKPFDEAVSGAANEEIDTLIVLENDLYRRAAETSVNLLFERSRQIIVLDHLMNKTVRHADILLPAATFAESQGTLVNNEGRAQRYYKAIVNKEPVKKAGDGQVSS